jgi:primosomal protein N' (replication factor Y)
VGQGTERLEEMLQERFPNTKLARIDSDATRKKGHLEALLELAEKKEAQILIGTQILAKGHHFPHLTLVAIVDADGGLFSVDFRAVERMAQLIIQVAGRAGRVHHAGEVVIQTLHPEHPLLRQILKQDYAQLAEMLLIERERCHLPPFSHFALIRAQASNPNLPEALLREVQAALSQLAIPNVRILGPVCAPMQKKQGHYRYQLLLQSNLRQPLHQILSYSTSILEKSKLAKRVRWSLDVDPLEML